MDPHASEVEKDQLPMRSGVEILGPLPAVDPEFADEQPLFAALGECAYERGGPITRAFLNRLPERFERGSMVVDSMLVWLQRGQALPSRWFHHEPFPGENNGAYVAANREPNVEFVACALGAPSHREFLIGEVEPFTDGLQLHGTPPEGVPLRDARLREQRDQRRLAALLVPVGQMHRYEAGTFLRVLSTDEAGLHFYIRAARGTERPVVNGTRNSVGPAVGPWQRRIAP